MSQFLIPVIFFTGITIFIIFVLLNQSKNTPDTNNDDDLEEWTCPDCNFSVQLGIECPFCYTKKPT